MTDSEQRRMFVFRLLDILLDMVWLCSFFLSLRVESSSFFQTLKTGNINLLNKSAENSRLVSSLQFHKLLISPNYLVYTIITIVEGMAYWTQRLHQL